MVQKKNSPLFQRGALNNQLGAPGFVEHEGQLTGLYPFK